MRAVNRSALVVRPKQPYIDWANRFEDGGPKFEPNEHEATVYLVNEYESEAQAQRVLKKCFAAIFVNELSGWMLDERAWPQERDFRTFLQWFQVSMHSVVEDLSERAFRT